MKICLVATFPPSGRQLNEYAFHIAHELRNRPDVELTILADELTNYDFATDKNGKPLDVPHGAPLRLRVERQLGYKMAKYVQHIQLVSDFRGIAGGHGGYWEDRGYDWYAGI